jgi:transposase
VAPCQSWEVSDGFWKRVEPLLPPVERDPNRPYQRKAGGGRKPRPSRRILEAILYALRKGCPWKALPKELFGSASAIHARFVQWMHAGVFHAMWRAGLAEWDEMEGIAWRWEGLDGALVKAPFIAEAAGGIWRNGWKGRKPKAAGDGRVWCPAVERRNRSKRGSPSPSRKESSSATRSGDPIRRGNRLPGIEDSPPWNGEFPALTTWMGGPIM